MILIRNKCQNHRFSPKITQKSLKITENHVFYTKIFLDFIFWCHIQLKTSPYDFLWYFEYVLTSFQAFHGWKIKKSSIWKSLRAQIALRKTFRPKSPWKKKSWCCRRACTGAQTSNKIKLAKYELKHIKNIIEGRRERFYAEYITLRCPNIHPLKPPKIISEYSPNPRLV